MVQPHSMHGSPWQDGATLIEACLALLLICLIFLGFFQVSRVFAARETLNYAAARAARAHTVGFDEWMVTKVARVAAIPNAGLLLTPDYENEATALRDAVNNERAGVVWDRVVRGDLWPLFTQAQMEMARMPEYLASQNSGTGGGILDYADWDDISVHVTADPLSSLLTVRVNQLYALSVPGSGSFYADGDIALEGESLIENHYPLYLNEQP